MQYKPIDKFFQYIQLDITDVRAESLGRVRKVINAEFALADTGIITIEGQTFSKQDLISVLDSQDAIEQLQAYHTIGQHSAFVEFLINGNFNTQIAQEVAILSNNDLVVAMTSADTAFQFNKNQRKLLTANRFEEAAQLMQLIPMILPVDYEEAFQALRQYMDDGIYLLKNTNKVTHFQRLQELHRWTMDWAQWANALPDFLLDHKQDLAVKLINYTALIQDEDKKMTYYISLQLIKLQFLTDTLSKLVIDNHAIYEKNAAPFKKGSQPAQRKYRSKKAKKYFWLLFFGILLLTRVITTFFKTDKKTSSPKFTTEQIDKNTLEILKTIRWKSENVFSEFEHFSPDYSAIPLSQHTNLIGYLPKDSTRRGVKIMNDTKVDFVLYLMTYDDLFELSLGKHSSMNFYYSPGISPSFLLRQVHTGVEETIDKNSLRNGKWIVFLEEGATRDSTSYHEIDSNTVLNIADRHPTIDFFQLTIKKASNGYVLQQDSTASIGIKPLE